MGQSSSSENHIPDTVGCFQEELFRHAHIIKEIAVLTYDDFQNYLAQLNALSKTCIDLDGKQLIFAVKKGTDSTLLWKGTVRIACVKIDESSEKVESYRLLNLRQFLRVFRTMQCQIEAQHGAQQHNNLQSSRETSELQRMSSESASEVSASQETCSLGADNYLSKKIQTPYSASMFLQEVDASCGENLDECCICLERKPDVILPCAHSYCSQCIQTWNVSHKTCPVCRETLESTDDTWVISEAPCSEEVTQEIQASLMNLASQQTPSP